MRSLKSLVKEKKGEMEITKIVQALMVGLLVLAIVAIALFAALTPLSSETVIPRKSIQYQFLGNTTFVLNTSAAATPTPLANLTSCSFHTGSPIVTANNATGAGEVISAGNYTVSGCTIIRNNVLPSGYNNSAFNASGFYQHTINSDAQALVSNVTTGTSEFFEQTPAIFSILGAALVIGAIVLIIMVAMRIKNRSSAEGSSGGL